MDVLARQAAEEASTKDSLEKMHNRDFNKHMDALARQADYNIQSKKLAEEKAAEDLLFQEQQKQLLLSGASSLFGSLAQIQAQFGDDQGNAYKVLFGLQKGFALAQSALAISSAWNVVMTDPTLITVGQKMAAKAALAGAVAGGLSQIASLNYEPRSQGGQIRAGQSYLVGEKGPELMTAGMSGRITNANDTSKMMGNSVNINVVNNHSGAKVEAKKDDKGDIVIMVRELMNQEVQNPNSKFNKAFDQTRNTQRRLT
jgi:hypothetical protein